MPAHPAAVPARSPGRPGWRSGAAALLLVAFAALTVAVLTRSPLVALDSAVFRWDPAAHWPALQPLVSGWVLLGQRAICLTLAAGWLAVRALRERDLRPLGTLLVATGLLNGSVGLVKALIGRLGPLQLGVAAALPGRASAFGGGTIFPSGHTANAVVTWVLLAALARRHRRVVAGLATLLAVTVGLATVYLGTHWVSDVLAGWVAGALVLLAVSPVERALRRAWPARPRRAKRSMVPVIALPRPALGQLPGTSALARLRERRRTPVGAGAGTGDRIRP